MADYINTIIERYKVKQNGWALHYVKEQTPEICLAAVKEDGCALHYVKEQTPEICLAAVKEDGCALHYDANRMIMSLYSDNSLVYYKSHSLAAGGTGTTKNCRHKARKT
jgi:hypothetical protein